ncbi:putative nucleic acid binding protein [Trachipleistophora hominis]|uniref:Putative nucleic acid binding protein n=1 Tax=Trachipleistophora hominis TaxID=72359 RepID=L7JR79_TRAHO|nr:putative nucleic acid binding protein [Trachipleistophora hominis]
MLRFFQKSKFDCLLHLHYLTKHMLTFVSKNICSSYTSIFLNLSNKFLPIMKIADINAYNKNFELTFMVIKNLGHIKTRDNDVVYSYLVADDTGSIEYSIFNQSLDLGDIIAINYAYATFFKTRLRVYNSELTVVRRVGEFNFEFKMSPNISERQRSE